MWVLIVLQIMSGAGIQDSYHPVVYSGVVMQEFASKDSCEAAKKTIQSLDADRNNTNKDMKVEIRDGIASMECVKK